MRTNKTLPASAALILEAKKWFADLRAIPPTETLLLAMEERGYRQSGNDPEGNGRSFFKRRV